MFQVSGNDSDLWVITVVLSYDVCLFLQIFYLYYIPCKYKNQAFSGIKCCSYIKPFKVLELYPVQACIQFNNINFTPVFAF